VPTPAVDARSDVSRVLPRALVEFQATDDVLLYAQYATGLRNGNTNSSAVLGVIDAFLGPGASDAFAGYGPDFVETYELGYKSRWLDGALTLNAALFHSEYQDLQTTQQDPFLGFGLVLNASSAVLTGIEVDFAYNPNENLRIFGGGNFIEAELDEEFDANTGAGVDLIPAGTRLSYTPEMTFNLGAEYLWPNAMGSAGFYLGADGNFVGEFASSFGADQQFLGEYGLLNLSTGLRADAWSLDLRVTNVTNEIELVAQSRFDDTLTGLGYVLSPGTSFNDNFVTQPRTVRLTLRTDF
jgi:iron complex outermembrane receptor protein